MDQLPTPKRPRKLMTNSGWTTSREPVAEGGAWKLRQAQGSLIGAIVLGIMAAFWNGITWTGVIAVWRDEHGLIAIGITVFLSIFVLIGLALAAAACYLLVKTLFSPRVELTVDAPVLTAGKSHAVHWTVTKGQQRLSTLELSLVLREECQYRRGTDTTTERHEISRHVLASHSEPGATGRCEVLLPVGALPSFSTTSNQLIWILQVCGSVRGLPDVDDEYPLRVVAEAPSVPALVATRLPDDAALEGQDVLLALAEPELPLAPGQPRAAVVGARTAATLRLRWITSGKGDSRSEVASELDLPPGCSAVVLTLPPTPPAWRGTILSLTWRLELATGERTLEQELSIAAPVSALVSQHP